MVDEPNPPRSSTGASPRPVDPAAVKRAVATPVREASAAKHVKRAKVTHDEGNTNGAETSPTHSIELQPTVLDPLFEAAQNTESLSPHVGKENEDQIMVSWM